MNLTNILIRQQNKINYFYFKHRYKVEQLYILKENETLFRQRFRYRLSVSVPLNKKIIEANTLFLVVFDELFINFGKDVVNYYFNQNWIYTELGYKINKATTVHIGYMNQYFPKPDGIRVENNHTLLISLGYNLDFRKTE